MTASPAHCPACHQPIPPGAPGGLCPSCVLRDADDPAPAPGLPAAPSLADVAAAFSQWEIIALIGQGGMGSVYQIRQPNLDRFAALKILSPSLGSDPAFAERFHREARLLARLNHPNIVAVYDVGETGGFFWLLMEFVDGVNLRQAMRAGRFTPEQALALVAPICDALQAAHAQGIWHRDIKPENILLDSTGRVKIADFGIARLVGDPAHDFALTATGAALGSGPYMAPEQIEKPHAVDHRADIYSLGVVIYEMLTGELPLGRFPAPSRFASVDARIDEIVLRTLEKERELRQQTATQVKTEIARAATEPPHSDSSPAPRAESPPAPPVSTPPQVPRKIPPVVWAVAAILAGAAWFVGGLGGMVGGFGVTLLVWLVGVAVFSVLSLAARRVLCWVATGLASASLPVMAVASTPFPADPWWDEGLVVGTVGALSVAAALVARLLFLPVRTNGKDPLFSGPVLRFLAAAGALLLVVGGMIGAKWLDGNWPFGEHPWKVTLEVPRHAHPRQPEAATPDLFTLAANAAGPLLAAVIIERPTPTEVSMTFREDYRRRREPFAGDMHGMAEAWILRLMDQLPVQWLGSVETRLSPHRCTMEEQNRGKRDIFAIVLATTCGGVLLAASGRRRFCIGLACLVAGTTAGALSPRWKRTSRFAALPNIVFFQNSLPREGPSTSFSDFSTPDRAFTSLCDAAIRDGVEAAARRHCTKALLAAIDRDAAWDRLGAVLGGRARAKVTDRSRPGAVGIRADYFRNAAFGYHGITATADHWMVQEDGGWKLDSINFDLPSLPACTPATLMRSSPTPEQPDSQ